MIIHRRIQHPVGQGFFHSGQVISNERTSSYIYDCGGDTDAVKRAIRDYKDSVSSPNKLNTLFISHFHDDHINGLNRLLTDITVDRVMLPYFDKYDTFFL